MDGHLGRLCTHVATQLWLNELYVTVLMQLCGKTKDSHGYATWQGVIEPEKGQHRLWTAYGTTHIHEAKLR
jgi:hypothetical protein